MTAFLVLLLATFQVPPLTQAPDSMALGAALAHARTLITAGDILVSPSSSEWCCVEHVAGSLIPEGAVLEQAARVAGFAFGMDREAVRCTPRSIVCNARGQFRGLLHVAGIRFAGDTMAVTLRILKFMPLADTTLQRSHVVEQVDEVYVLPSMPGPRWRVVRVRHVSVT